MSSKPNRMVGNAMKKRSSLLFLMTFIATMSSIGMVGVKAASQISSDAECGTCLGSTDVVCRAENYDRFAYCCNVAEVGSRGCGGSSAFCSSNSLNPTIDNYACPYSSTYCGASSSELVMHPNTRNNLKIEISNRLFLDTETCYYVFSMNLAGLDT